MSSSQSLHSLFYSRAAAFLFVISHLSVSWPQGSAVWALHLHMLLTIIKLASDSGFLGMVNLNCFSICENWEHFISTLIGQWVWSAPCSALCVHPTVGLAQWTAGEERRENDIKSSESTFLQVKQLLDGMTCNISLQLIPTNSNNSYFINTLWGNPCRQAAPFNHRGV